jgi:hypothetical protein
MGNPNIMYTMLRRGTFSPGHRSSNMHMGNTTHTHPSLTFQETVLASCCEYKKVKKEKKSQKRSLDRQLINGIVDRLMSTVLSNGERNKILVK